jgi:small subunit ribosomal protein S19
MTRAKWKGPFMDKKFLKSNKLKPNLLTIRSRRSVIPSYLVGKNVQIYNGQTFKSVRITSQKVGFKFGEFAGSRQKRSLNKKKKKK